MLLKTLFREKLVVITDAGNVVSPRVQEYYSVRLKSDYVLIYIFLNEPLTYTSKML